jgi:DNA replication protein DnaC
MNPTIEQKMSQLRLFGLRENAERRIAEAVSANLHPEEFLLLLLDDEIAQRKEMLSKRLQTKAKFRYDAHHEDWDWLFERGMSKTKIQDAISLGFLRDREQLLLLGPTGIGKTHLAIAIGRRACHTGKTVAFFGMNTLFEEALGTKASGKYRFWLKTTASRDLIILDDFALRKYTHEEGSIILDLLEEHHKKGSIVVTSQVAAEGWPGLFDDPVLGEAIVDRMTKPQKSLIFDGASYRDKGGLKKPGKGETVAPASKKR